MVFEVYVIFTLRATGVVKNTKLIKLICLLLFHNTNTELLWNPTYNANFISTLYYGKNVNIEEKSSVLLGQ